MHRTTLAILCGCSLAWAAAAESHDLGGRWRLIAEYRPNSAQSMTPMMCEISDERLRFEIGTSHEVRIREAKFETTSSDPPWRMRLENGRQLACIRRGDTLSIYTPTGDHSLPDQLDEQTRDQLIHRVFRRAAADQEAVSAIPETWIAGDLAVTLPLRDRLLAVASEADVPTQIFSAGRHRDPQLARERKLEFQIRKEVLGKPAALTATEIEELLTLDFRQPQLHLQSMRLAADEDAVQNVESLWQATECLRQLGAEEPLLAEGEQLCKSLPPRSVELDAKQLSGAIKTFEAGLPMFIEFDGPQPLELDASAGICRLKLPLRYIRSPSLSLIGCRVVAKLVVKRDEQPMLLSHETGFRPCAFLAGSLDGTFYAIGRIPIREDSTLMIYATTLGANPQQPHVPISNVVSVPLKAHAPASVE